MPFRFLARVLHTPETLFTLAIGLLVSVIICLGSPPNETDPNVTNRLFLHLIEGVILIGALWGAFRVWSDSIHATDALPDLKGWIESQTISLSERHGHALTYALDIGFALTNTGHATAIIDPCNWKLPRGVSLLEVSLEPASSSQLAEGATMHFHALCHLQAPDNMNNLDFDLVARDRAGDACPQSLHFGNLQMLQGVS